MLCKLRESMQKCTVPHILNKVNGGYWEFFLFGFSLLYLCRLVPDWNSTIKFKSNETPTWCNTAQVLFLQSHSTCFGRKRPSSGVLKTSTAATGTVWDSTVLLFVFVSPVSLWYVSGIYCCWLCRVFSSVLSSSFLEIVVELSFYWQLLPYFRMKTWWWLQ